MPILQQINNDDLKHPGNDPNVTDPQENEKEGNVFGKVFDAIFGNFEGKNVTAEDEINPKQGKEEELDTE